MRNQSFLALLSLVLSACASDALIVPERPERTSVLVGTSDLEGLAIAIANSEGWVIRKTKNSQLGVASKPGGRGFEGSKALGKGGGRELLSSLRAVGGAESGSHTAEMLSTPAPSGPSTPGPAGSEPAGSDPAGALPPAGSLRAGMTDDAANHEDFIAYLEKNKAGLAGRIENLSEADRREVVVQTAAGEPIPAAEVVLVDEDRDRVVWRGTTYGDGRLPVFKSRFSDDTSAALLIEVVHGDQFVRHRWNGEGREVVVRMPRVEPEIDELALDVVFLIDTTGSMSDEITAIKDTLLAVTAKLKGLDQEFDLRYGAVLYRDITDAYVTKAHPFTGDIAAFDRALKKIEAQGGGDTPESLNQGLAVAIDGMNWRQGAAKIVFLIADAPPHLDYKNDVPYGKSLEAAVAQGIRIHAVAASGLDAAGTAVFRQVAHFARGKFIFIEYGGSVQKTAEGHGVTAPVKGNNLDDILFEQIRDEIAQWGRRAG